jgi:hypothetical protein
MDDEPIRPEHPLWDGIYDFAWRPGNAKGFVTTSICMVFLAFFAVCFYGFAELLSDMEQSNITIVAGSRIFAGLIFLSFICSIFPSACFIRIIESTAGGDDRISWHQGVWFDFLKDILFLFWILGWSLAVPVIALTIASSVTELPESLWWIILPAATVVVLPIFLLSTMMGNAPWVLIHYRVLERFVQLPQVPAMMYLNTAFLGFPCVLLAYWMMTGYHFLWAPIAGIIWATYWMTYARVLGRVGWILTEDPRYLARRKKRRKVEVEEKDDQ